MMLGQLDGALAELRRARDLDPLSAIINTRIGTMLAYMGRYEDAVVELRKALGVDPSNVLARFELGRALAGAGKFDEAFREFPDAIDAEAGRSMGFVAWAEARAGRRDKARLILQRLQARSKERYITPDGLAGAAAAAGERSLALEYLEQGLREHSFYTQAIRFDPTYEELRSEPRFQRILSQVESKYAVGPQSKR
jgi:tetratricopeptide (TPR) repeat protein